MKLVIAGAAVVLSLLTAGCSSGSGTHAASSSTAAVTSGVGTAAVSPSGLATSPGAGAAAVSPSGGSTSLPAPATAATAASQGASRSAAASAATGGTAAPIVVCTILPTPQVASLSGLALTSSREQDFAADNAYTCDYNTASGAGGMSVTVSAAGGAAAYASSLSTDTVAGSAEHVTPVAGIGDKSFSARDGVRALFGDRMIYVAGLTSVQPAEAIIQALQAKLP